ncbi:hypothetical protein D3C76_1397810 [compost metagenome]
MVEFILNLAYDLFHDIFKCDKPGGSAVFINQNRNLCLATLHTLEQITDQRSIWHSQDGPDYGDGIRKLGSHQILNVNKADNMILVSVIYRIPGTHAFARNLQILQHGLIGIQTDHFRPRNHNFTGGCIRKIKYIINKC